MARARRQTAGLLFTAAVFVAGWLSILHPQPASATGQVAPPEAVCRYHNPKIRSQLLNAQEAAVEPWSQQRLRFTDAWPFSRGAGVTVAIVDSGVDAGQEQLSGRVLPGWDVTSGSVRPGGTSDCYAHGTLVAGIVAAQSVPGRALVGVAPDAKILPIRENWGIDADAQETQGSTGSLLQAMRVAVNSGAKVMNVSITVADNALTDVQRQQFADLAQFASDHDVLIVAATGNKDDLNQQNGASQQNGANQPEVATYPARLAQWYPNVIAVSGIDSSGAVDGNAITGPFVTLVAPDQGMPCLMAHGGLVPCQGTSFAAPFVSGVAALVRSRFPAETAEQVRARLQATADPPDGDVPDPNFGFGVVNPLAAVTAVLPAQAPDAAGPPSAIPHPSDPAAGRRRLAMVVAAGGLALAGLLPVASATLRRGRRRGWRPGIQPMDQAPLSAGPAGSPPVPTADTRSEPVGRRGG